VVAGDGELGGRQGNHARDLPQPVQCTGISGLGGTVQFAGLAAELIQIGVAGKP
jgi:hypothetical protein